jgi:hypothetical protein
MGILSATLDAVAGVFRSLIEPLSRGFWHIPERPGKAQEA